MSRRKTTVSMSKFGNGYVSMVIIIAITISSMTTLATRTIRVDASPIVEKQGNLVQLCLQQVLLKNISRYIIPNISGADCSDWKSFCNQASQMDVLTIPCSQLVTPNGTLTSTGWIAVNCIMLELSPSNSFDPGMLATPIHPECEGIVNMTAIMSLPPYPYSFPILR
jgi:hypothetical protein